MKILLVMPGEGRMQQKPSFKPLLPPSPLLEVAGMTNPDHHEVKIWDELARGPVLDEILTWADLVGISGLTTSRLGAYRVAEAARRLNKLVVAGGMDVTGHYSEGNSDELLVHYDAIVVGRLTSRLWAEVLADVENHRLELVYRAESLDDEDWEWVVPRHDLVDRRRYYFPATFRSSAGCPYGCNFCTVGLICDQVQTKPYDLLEVELYHLSKMGRLLVDYSDSFGADYGHTVKVVLPLYRKLGWRWLTEITVGNLMGIENGQEPLIGPMADAGCECVYIGIESIFGPIGLKSLKKANVEEAIKKAHQAGLVVIGSLVLDLTGSETEQSIRQTVEWVIDQGLDLVQYSLTAALSGSVLRRHALARGQLITLNPEHYNGGWPTILHPLSAQKRIELLAYAYHRTYSLAGITRRIFHRPFSFPNLGANLVFSRMAQEWRKVGYDYWKETRNCES